MLEIRMLGQFSVRLDEEPVDIRLRPAQSLLAYLVLNAGRAYRREKLAGLFWPEASEVNARKSLRHALWRVRKALGEDRDDSSRFLTADSFTLAFDAGNKCWVDVWVLQQPYDKNTSPDSLVDGVAVYGGELLPGFYEDWVVLERERLRATLDDRMQTLLTSLTSVQRWPDLLEWAERWIALGHVPEPAYRALMLAHNGLGDAAGVAVAFQRCKSALQEDLGVDPSEQTQALYEWLSEGGPQPEGVFGIAPPRPPLAPGVAVDSLLQQWRSQDKEILDVASLAIVNAAGEDYRIKSADASLVIRSALHHGVDVDPWIDRLASADVAVTTLVETFRDQPGARTKRRIVDALIGLHGDQANTALLQIATSDNDARVREEAALAVARRGHGRTIAAKLAEELNTAASPAALAAFVAVADEVGLPDGIGPYPRLWVALTLAQRRWRRHREPIWSQTLWVGLAGGLAAGLVGGLAPLAVAVAFPDEFRQNLEFITAAGWVFSGLAIGLLWGGLQGAVLGLMVGLADALVPGKSQRTWRLLLGGAAGIVNALFLVSFSLMDLLDPEALPGVYIPAQLLYSVVRGALLSLVIPRLGVSASPRNQANQLALTSLLLAILTALYAVTVYPDSVTATFLTEFVTNFIYALGVALALSEANRRLYRVQS